jgi:CDP-diacylglycerol---glycerol-3-phosphate 3-phosphatidyltransferase
MSLVTEKPVAAQPLFNVPNQLTVSRLLLSIVLFVFIGLQYYLTSLVLFAIAASTDWLDGYWARKYGQVTNLGRILDPFVDKIIICGSFIFLVAVPNSGITPWMAVVVVGRELLVTALRSYLEGEGADFSANMAGKLKMVLQCAAVLFSLYALSQAGERPEWLAWALVLSVWGAVLLTLYSGLAYIQRAVMLLRVSR